jgi:hypothetical protein
VVSTASWISFAVQPPDVGAGVQEDLHEADDARLVDLDAGIAHRALGDGQRDALQERKVDHSILYFSAIGNHPSIHHAHLSPRYSQ